MNITKLVADAWRNISPEDKAKYEEMAREDKERYNQERASFKGNLSRKRHRDPNAPKRPMSAYLAFANSLRAEVKLLNPDCSNGEISKMLSQRWKTAPEDEKKKYKDEEAAKWSLYREEMVAWKKKNDGRKRAMRAFRTSNPEDTKGKKKVLSPEDGHSPGEGFDDQQFAAYGSALMDQANPSQDGKLNIRSFEILQWYRFLTCFTTTPKISWLHLQHYEAFEAVQMSMAEICRPPRPLTPAHNKVLVQAPWVCCMVQ